MVLPVEVGRGLATLFGAGVAELRQRRFERSGFGCGDAVGYLSWAENDACHWWSAVPGSVVKRVKLGSKRETRCLTRAG